MRGHFWIATTLDRSTGQSSPFFFLPFQGDSHLAVYGIAELLTRGSRDSSE